MARKYDNRKEQWLEQQRESLHLGEQAWIRKRNLGKVPVFWNLKAQVKWQFISSHLLNDRTNTTNWGPSFHISECMGAILFKPQHPILGPIPWVLWLYHNAVLVTLLVTITRTKHHDKATYRRNLGLLVLEGIESMTTMMTNQGSREIWQLKNWIYSKQIYGKLRIPILKSLIESRKRLNWE